MWGNDPAGFIAAAQLRGRPVGDEFDVCTMEGYLKRSRPGLVESGLVLDSAVRSGGGHRALVSLADEGIESPIAKAAATKFNLDARPDPSSLPSLVDRIQQDLSLCPGTQLPKACESALRALQNLTFDSDGEQVFPNSAVHWIRRDEALVHRVKLASVLLRLQRDGRLAGGDARQVLAQHRAGENIFASSSALSDGVYLFDAYVAPLLASLSPAVWGFPVHRVHGTIVFIYGRPISGTSNQPGELLRTLRTVGADSEDVDATRYESFASADAAASAIAWWTNRIDEMFGVLTDPVVFADDHGRYDPTAALQALLGVEQVFRRTNSLLLVHHDTHARRALAFTVLDTLRTLTAVNLDRMFDYESAALTLEHLESDMPAESHDILLPAARRAVRALRSVQDGFFLRGADGSITLTDRPVKPATAAAEYLGMLRDATHGFTTTRTAAKQRDKIATLLAVHNGKVHHDVGMIAWLYLLDFLARPERFRSVMSHESRRT